MKPEDFTTYQLVRIGREYGLRNKGTGQIDHSGFASKKQIAEFWNLHFSWNKAYKLER